MPATQEQRDRLAATERCRRTTAPIARCTFGQTDDTAPPLRFLRARYTARLKLHQLARRARLLYGRSYTATVRRRLPTDAAAAAAATTCTQAECSADGLAESIEHLLLRCPLYRDARDALLHKLYQHALPLTLTTILNPPEHDTRHFLALCDATHAFMDAIESARLAHGLPSLDTCPRYSASNAALQQHQPAQAAPPAASLPLAAHAAPLPLNTA